MDPSDILRQSYSTVGFKTPYIDAETCLFSLRPRSGSFQHIRRCISISNGRVLITHGLETLAATSADGFYRTLHHPATVDPSSSALVDIQRHYNKVFPSELDFTPFHSTMTKIHSLAGRFGNPDDIQWSNPRLSIQEQIPFVRRMAETVQDGYQQAEQRKVPRRILRSVLYFLSLCPLSPTSVVADCLTIVAIDLDCDARSLPFRTRGTSKCDRYPPL